MKYFAFILGCLAICALAFAQDGADILQTEAEEDYFQAVNQQQQQAAQAQAQNPTQSVIYVFFDNQPCQTCPQAIAMIEEAYRENWQGIYDFYVINYQEEEDAGNYNFAENYNLELPLSVVLQAVEDGRFTRYQKLPYLYNFNPYTYQEAFLSEVSTFFENEGNPYASW